jgi:hypothetical protein
MTRYLDRYLLTVTLQEAELLMYGIGSYISESAGDTTEADKLYTRLMEEIGDAREQKSHDSSNNGK